MDLTAEVITKVLEISAPELHTVKDVHEVETIFSTKPLHQIVAAAPAEPKPVIVNTLSGFADLVKAKLEGMDFPAAFLIHVEDEGTVTLKAKDSDEFGRRLVLIKAHPVEFTRFKFGQWHDQESFSIALASLFVGSDDKDYVLNLSSSLTNEATTNMEDNGFTQKATVKAGLAHKALVVIKPVVALAPYRTFPEVTQPMSQFVLRARTEDKIPALMLVEADGGRWKVNAIAEIRSAMEAFGLGIPIIA